MSSHKLKIKYIAFYNDSMLNKEENRNTHLGATNKVSYICSALKRNGYEVEIVSPCWTNNQSGYYKGNRYNISENISLKNFATFGSRTKLAKKAKQIFAALQLFIYLLIRTQKYEQIIVYHSLALMIPIQLAKKAKKLKLILEVEEVYTEVWKTKSTTSKEIAYINKADKYILVSDVLKEKFHQKPSAVLYGSYQVLDKHFVKKSQKDTVDIVYAGSIDETKGGAVNAVKSMKYLPENYFMHILGFGEKPVVDKLQQEIKSINNLNGSTCCKFHGTLVGGDYRDFLLNCDIGVNPQYSGDYMNTAFPSKLLSYLTHNLKVVSTKITSIKFSKVEPFITFAESDKPKDIAEAIINAAAGPTNHSSIVKDLDNQFVGELKALI